MLDAVLQDNMQIRRQLDVTQSLHSTHGAVCIGGGDVAAADAPATLPHVIWKAWSNTRKLHTLLQRLLLPWVCVAVVSLQEGGSLPLSTAPAALQGDAGG